MNYVKRIFDGDLLEEYKSMLGDKIYIKTATSGLYEASAVVKFIIIISPACHMMLIIKPNPEKPMKVLKDILQDSNIIKVFHDINFHMTMIKRCFDKPFKTSNCRCIKFAGLMLGNLYVGLSNLCETYLGHKLPSNKKNKGFKDCYDLDNQRFFSSLYRETFVLVQLYEEVLFALSKVGKVRSYYKLCELFPIFLEEEAKYSDHHKSSIKRVIAPEQYGKLMKHF